MTKHDHIPWERIEAIFFEAVAAPRDTLGALLDRLCDGDDGLRREVEELLAAHERGSLLDGGAINLVSVPALMGLIDEGEGGDDPLIDRHLGPYRIVAPIGEGGMGVVYRAVRDDDQYRKEVALKVVRTGMDDPEIIRRFMEERQILASLEHPNVARLLDGGMTSNGRPWVAMEYIADGLPLDRYCDDRSLNLPSRLLLFNAVASAVHYAHQNLIVHRDLKMGNILVTSTGDPKLLDFGIARYLQDGATVEPGEMTRIGLRMLTPEYASPEQLTGGAITTASDIYSLGVILYILLCGHRPYAPWRNRPTHELERAICHESPPPPSDVLRRDDPGAPDIASIAAVRSTSPDRLRRDLSGDLDTIVMQAMDKDPARRYASVQGLAEDLGRFLAGLPVLARRDTLGYRAGKFVRRHVVGVASASALFLSVAGFGLSMARQRSRIARQSRQIRSERDRAERIVSFLKDLFMRAEPGSPGGGGDVTARELLQRGWERVQRELAGEPEAQSELMHVIGQVQMGMGLFDEAAMILQAALDLRAEAYGDRSVEYATTLHQLAGACRLKGDHSGAETLFRNALAIARRHGAEETELVADIVNELGILLNTMQRYDDAERHLRHALDIRRRIFPPDHSDIPRSLNNLGLLLVDLRRFDEAEPLFLEALDLLRRIRPDGSPDIAATLNNLGVLMRGRKRLDEAEAFDREALAIRRRLYDGDHPNLAQSLNNLGNLLYRRGRHAEASELFHEALDLWRRLLGPDHPDVIVGMTNLAQVERQRGDLTAAQSIMEEALDLQCRRRDDRDPAVVRSIALLGEILLERGRPAEGTPLLQKALMVRRATLGDDHWRTALTACALAEGLAQLGEIEEARVLFSLSARALERQGHADAERPLRGLSRLH